MKRRVFFKFCIFSLWFLSYLSAFANSPFFNSIHQDSAAVLWVLYDGNQKINGKDKGFFKDAASLNRKVFCSSQSVFKIPNEHCFEVALDASLSLFESTIQHALNQLRLAEKPLLFVSIDSEGTQGQIVGQNGKRILYKELLDAIFDQVDVFEAATKKKLALNLFINACKAHSIFPILQERIKGKYGIYRNEQDDEWYQYELDLFTSSDADQNSYANHFLETLLEIAKANEWQFDKESWPLFCSKDTHNSHHVWSSYCSYPKIALNWIKKAMNSSLVFHDPWLEAEVLNEMESVSASEIYDVIPILEEHPNVSVRVTAANLLARMGAKAKHAVSHLEKIILNESESMGMRIVSVNVLAKIGLDVEGVRDVLKKAMHVEGEHSTMIRHYAKRALANNPHFEKVRSTF